MKNIEVSNFKIEALAGNEPVCVENNGKLIGYYYPVKEKAKKLEESDALWQRLDAVLERAARESGLEREALINALDPSKPFPFESPQLD